MTNQAADVETAFEHTRTCDDLMIGRYVRRMAEGEPYAVGDNPEPGYLIEEGLRFRGRCTCAADRLKAIKQDLARLRAAQRHTYSYDRAFEIDVKVRRRDRLAAIVNAQGAVK